MRRKLLALLFSVLVMITVIAPMGYATPPMESHGLPESCVLAMSTVTNSWHWFTFGAQCMLDLIQNGDIIYY